MKYWRKARGVRIVGLVGVATLLALTISVTSLTVTPSPGGATLGLATVLALAIPVLAGWGNSRGDRRLEERSVRHIPVLDLGLVLVAGVGLAGLEAAMRALGLAPAGLVAARATLTYIGLVLVAVPFTGWGNAAMLPVVYLIAALLLGRGDDVDHPAFWSWIAAPEEDLLALVSALATAGLGAVICGVHIASDYRQAARPQGNVREA